MAYRRYWCRNGVDNLFDAEAVWPSAETCAKLEPDDLRSGQNYWHGRNRRWTRPQWGDFTSPASRAARLRDAVDKPHGVRVTGVPCESFVSLCWCISLSFLSSRVPFSFVPFFHCCVCVCCGTHGTITRSHSLDFLQRESSDDGNFDSGLPIGTESGTSAQLGQPGWEGFGQGYLS